MKYVNMGTPDFEVHVPSSPLPVIVGTHDFTTGEQGQSVALHSVLYYPERSYASPLQPREVLKRFAEANGKSDVPGLNYD